MSAAELSLYAVGDVRPDWPNPDSIVEMELVLPLFKQADVLFGNLESPVVEFFLELGFDGLGLPAIGSSGGLLVTDSVTVKIGPPNIATFKQAHFVVCPPCWFSIQRITWSL